MLNVYELAGPVPEPRRRRGAQCARQCAGRPTRPPASALSRGERLEDFVDAVRERSSGITPQTPGKGRVRADPLLAALQAHGVDVRGPRALGDRSNAVEDEAPVLSQAF